MRLVHVETNILAEIAGIHEIILVLSSVVSSCEDQHLGHDPRYAQDKTDTW